MERDNRLAVFLAALHSRDSLAASPHGGGRACLDTHPPPPAAELSSPSETAAAIPPAWFPVEKRNRVCELVRGVLLPASASSTITSTAAAGGAGAAGGARPGAEQEQEREPRPSSCFPPHHHLLEPVLTTLGRQDPPRFDAALRLIRYACGGVWAGERPQRLLKYLAFFAPDSEGGIDALYAVALGMYDFPLARALARLSPGKDPREYLPLLERWEGMRPPWRARVEVDLLLQRPRAALAHMAGAAEEEVDPQEVLGIVEGHGLEEEALGLFSSSSQSQASRVYARLLGRVAAARAARGEHAGAMAAYLALAAAAGGQGQGQEEPAPVLRAAECARAAGEWATALALVARHEEEEGGKGQGGLVRAWARQLMLSAAAEEAGAGGMIPLGEGVDKGRRARALVEAARLGLACTGDAEAAVALLVGARAWGEALRVGYTTTITTTGLVAAVVRPAAVALAGELAWARLPRWRDGYEEGAPRLAALLVRVAAEDAAAAEAARERALAQANEAGAASEAGGGGGGNSVFSAAPSMDSVGSAASYRSGGSSFSSSSAATRHSRLTWASEAAVSSTPASSFGIGGGKGVGEVSRQARRAQYKAAKRARAKPPTAREAEQRLRRELQGLVPSPAALGEVAWLLEALLALGETRRARALLRAVRALVAAVAALPLPPPPLPLPSGCQGGEEKEKEEAGLVAVEEVAAGFDAALGRFVFLLGPPGGGGDGDGQEEEGKEEGPA